MNKRARRRFTPDVGTLERRRLMTLSALWLGQDGGDYVGTEGTLAQQVPNDYQDVHFRLTGLSGAAVARVDVERYGGGAWTWSPAGGKNAMFLPGTSAPTTGDVYFEPYFADPAGTYYQAIRVTYADGSVEQTQATASTAVDPNLRTPGKQLSATFRGQDGQDWTGATISVGPDGFQDVHLSIANLSAGASGYVRVTAATNPPRSWESGVNPDGRWNAELLNRAGVGSTLGTTADVYFSSDVDLKGVPLTVQVFYDHWNPDYRSYTNRSGKSDAFTVIAGQTNPLLKMPAVAEADLAAFSAASTPQDAAYPGLSHAALGAASLGALAAPQSFASVRSAVLTNEHGAAWIYFRPGTSAPYTGFYDPRSMTYDASSGSFNFAPVRDESGSTLTLLLTFDDGSKAVSRFAGAQADLGRLAVDTRVGASVKNVSDGAGLLAAIAADAPIVHLAAGVYTLDRPLDIDSPVRITADAGATLNFVLSSSPSSPWSAATGAIQVRSSHVALEGFAIRFTGTTADWNTWSRNVIQAGLGTTDVDLEFRDLDVVAPAAAVPGVYEVAVALMNFEDGDTGVIADNALQGGWIQLGAAPWLVEGNDYRGALDDTIAPTFLNVHRSFDLTIRGNHAHVVAPRGITQRFIVMGNSDSGQGIGNLIEGNTIDGGVGTPATGAPDGYNNNPEIILTETYQPRFEGVPSAVSPDGYIMQVPYLRGPAARTGDVVSILTGPHAGEWRMIAQALGPTRYLLDEPLPAGSFAIAIGRGYVDQAYVGNTIDLRGMSPNNVAVVISGNHWGQRIEGNTFYGGEALRVGAGSSEGAFEGQYPAPWGWSRLPMLGLEVSGNTFVDSGVTFGVAHDRWANKASAGRTYFTADFSGNTIDWTDPTAPAVSIGSAGDPANGAPAYTLANYPWVTPGEIVLTASGNWSGTAARSVPATIKVYAAVVNGEVLSDATITVPAPPAAPTIPAASRGQDGRDYVGLGPNSNGPDGFQDVHVVLSNIPAGKAIARIVVGDVRPWSTDGADRLAYVRNGSTVDLYFQPYQDEDGRSVTVEVFYTDGTSSRGVVDSLYATARQPMPTNVATQAAPAVVSARGDNAAAGESKLHAFDGDRNTKWLDFSGTSWIQYQFAGGTAQVVTSYTITTANDTAQYPGRAPKSWVLKGSSDGINWAVLDVRSNAAVTMNYASVTYRFANTSAYRYYRLDSIVSNGDPIVQLADVRFNLAAGGTTASLSAAAGDNAQAGEGAAQAFDGNVDTKWLDFSGTSWLQYATPDGVARVVSQYAITSANDTAQYPGRAPKSWVLKASNDGVNWTTLDVRTDEADTANLSTRVYRIDNRTAYKVYRLDSIVSNGDPIVQLAEVSFQSDQVVAIDAGGSTTGSFRSDAYYTGGRTGSTTHAVDLSGVADPAPQSAYQTDRYGDLSYTIPGLTPGATYTVRLHFAETYWSRAGQRTFDVAINGSTVLDHFDIYAQAGGMYKAIVREFDATADASGRIVVAFNGAGQPDNPKVNAIEVVVPRRNLALGATATSSSDESAAYAPALAVDGGASTRWSSGQWMRDSEDAWYALDLGAKHAIDAVELTWEAAYAVDYRVQVSDDGRDWTTVRTVAGATAGGVVRLGDLGAAGRYVRISMTRTNGTRNYSLFNVAVYGA